VCRRLGGRKGAPLEQGILFLYGKGNKNHQLGTGFFVKIVEFVSDRMSYIVLRGYWCHIIVLNMHAPSQKKSDNSKGIFYEDLQEFFFNNFPQYHMKILLGDFNAKLGREDIFKPTVGSESLHQDNNDTGVRIVNFAT